jgi:phosphoglycolate phosphatase-like HAD superfamily hydrolase
MIRAIIFDLDGTLVDAYPGIHQSLNETLRELQLPEVDLHTVKRRVGRGVVNLMQRSVPEDLFEKGLELFHSSYDRTHLSGTFLLPDVKETLELLDQRGILLAVASNKPTEFTRNIINHFALGALFQAIVGPTPEIPPKPDPPMLQHLLRVLKVSAQETLYVGDMVLDAETARNSEVWLALIPSGGHSREELEGLKPDFLLNRFGELIQIVNAEV